jgi:hypothetical protein
MTKVRKLIGTALAVAAGAVAFQQTQLTADQDRQRLLDLLHIQSLRPGADAQESAIAPCDEL